jgi:hypothetical protein
VIQSSPRYKQKGRGLSRDEFIAEYESGKRFDMKSRRWVTPDGKTTAPPERFPEDVTTEQVLERLTGDASDSSFKAYADKLKVEKIATEAQLRAAIDAAKPQGRTINAVRHQLKLQFREPLLQRMTSPDPVAMEQRHPDLPWVKDPEGAYLQAKHREMLRLTEGLNSSDMGNLAEVWYNRTHRPGETAHVRLTPKELGALGIKGPDGAPPKERFLDLVGADTMREQYTGSGKFDARKIDQIQTHLDLLNRPGGFDVSVGGTPVRVTKGSVVLTNPHGVKANAETMHRILIENPNMSCEIFNAKGGSKTVSKGNASELLEPALSDWLAIPK